MEYSSRSCFVALRLLLLFGLFHESFQRRDFYVQYESCEIDSSNSKICEANCTLAKKGDVSVINAFVNYLEPVDSFGVTVEFKGRAMNGAGLNPLMGQTRSSRAGSWIVLFNQTIADGCRYLKANSRSNLFEIAIDEFLKNGKMPKCPVEKDVYYIKDYYFSPENLPAMIPEAEFKSKGVMFGVKGGQRMECGRYKMLGKIRQKKNSMWG